MPRSTVNQTVQFGVETTRGVSVPANKLLNILSFKIGPEIDSKEYRPDGRKYNTDIALNKESSSGSFEGPMDYNALVYILSSAWGATSPTAYQSSATAKLWSFSPPVAGDANPTTYTFEQGDSTRAHKISYGLFKSFSYKLSRDEFSCSGDLIGQLLTDGITMTPSATSIPNVIIQPSDVNIYLDTAPEQIGQTILPGALSFEYKMTDIFDAAWFVRRSDASWSSHVDLAPKVSATLLHEGSNIGMSLYSHMRAGKTIYMRIEAVGEQIATDGPGAVSYSFIHDLALKVAKMNEFSDEDVVFAASYDLSVIESEAWDGGKAQEIKIVNLLDSL